MSRSEIIRFLILRTLGNFLVLIALYGVVLTFGPAVMFQITYQLIQLRGIHFTVQSQKNIALKPHEQSQLKTQAQPQASPGFAAILTGNKEQIMTAIDPLFSILIPKLGIDEQVIPNVDPSDPKEYLPVLQHAVAHARGSVFPGFNGTTYLFAHSADNWWDIEHYNAIFYTLNNLLPGDEIDIFFENRRFEYVMSSQ